MIVSLDNLIYNVENVTAYQWDNFVLQLEIAETYGKIPRVRRVIGVGYSKYHHQVNIGEGAGAISIGYKHNSSPENEDSYRLRFEVNPSKGDSEARRNAVDIFLQCFSTNTKLIKGADIAFDIPLAKDSLYVVSNTGRQRQIIKTTTYYGERGQNGYLKVYDKKKELQKKQGIEIEEEHLTRVEFSLRLENPVTLHLFSKMKDIWINNLYQVSELDIPKTDGAVKACLIAVTSGAMQMRELSRTFQQKTKKALADMGLLDLDHEYANAHSEITKTVSSFISTQSFQYPIKHRNLTKLLTE